MNTVSSNMACQPLQPKNQTSFRGKQENEDVLLALTNSTSVDDFVSNPDAIKVVSNAVVDLADKGNKGAEALGTLAMLAGIGVGGYVVASKAAKRVLTSLGGKTQYLDGFAEQAVKLFKKAEGAVQNIELGENAGRVKKFFVGVIKKVSEGLREMASKGLDDDTLKKNFAEKLSKGAADLTEEELSKFPDWLKKTKDLDFSALTGRFAKEAGQQVDGLAFDNPTFVKWVKDNVGVDLGMARSEYAKGFKKTINDLTADDLASFGKYKESVKAKNGITQLIGNLFGLGAGTKAVAGVGKDEDKDGIPDGLQKQTIQQKFNAAVGALVLESSKNVS